MGKHDKKSKKKKSSRSDDGERDRKKRKAERREEEEEERKRSKHEKELEKARMKANETPEERNARRMAKKLAKQAKKAEEKSLFGYTNENNPFGDANLTKAFVWKKKYEKQVETGEKVKSLTKQQLREKQITLRQEIEKVKHRRAEREIEQAQMDEMREQIERDAMREQIEGWEEKEEEFHRSQVRIMNIICSTLFFVLLLTVLPMCNDGPCWFDCPNILLCQARKRSEIRIKEKREKAVDILVKILHYLVGNNFRSFSSLGARARSALPSPNKLCQTPNPR